MMHPDAEDCISVPLHQDFNNFSILTDNDNINGIKLIESEHYKSQRLKNIKNKLAKHTILPGEDNNSKIFITSSFTPFMEEYS